MSDVFLQLQEFVSHVKHNLPLVMEGLAFLWLFNIVNFLLHGAFNHLGIYPRRFSGLSGIIFSPFLHGHFNHLFFNSVALFFFANMVLLYGVPAFCILTIWIMVVGGGLVWCFGRPALHIGASTLIMGYWGYLLMSAVFINNAMALLLGFISLYYFGGLFFDLFPTDAKTSWEGHLFGAIAGIMASIVSPVTLLIHLINGLNHCLMVIKSWI